jgi:hypothetical protein
MTAALLPQVLMELYEPDAALIAQPGSVAHGREQAPPPYRAS